MTDTIELKPCPFCGEPINLPRSRQSSADSSEGFVAFAVCYCGGYSMTAHQMGSGVTEMEAIRDAAAKWNRRAQPASVPDEVRKDAERYRWLRERQFSFSHDEAERGIAARRWGEWHYDTTEGHAAQMDAAIDAAMATKEVKQ